MGCPAPESQVPPGGARAVPQIFTEVRSRDGCLDRRKDVGSKINICGSWLGRRSHQAAWGPFGPCGVLPPSFHEVLEPLEHSVLVPAGPARRLVAVGPVGPLRTLSPSDCHPAGPAGPYVARALLAQMEH